MIGEYHGIAGSPTALFAEAFPRGRRMSTGFYPSGSMLDRPVRTASANCSSAIKAAGFGGANITYPFGRIWIPLLNAVDPEVQPR